MMARFEYDGIESEELILEFHCSSCHNSIVTKRLQVPKMNIDNLSSKNTLSYQQVCECGKEFLIHIYNGIFANYGEVSNLDDDNYGIVVHEIPSIPHGKETIFVDTIHSFTIIDSIVEEIERNKIGNDTFLYNLLFSNMISLVDSFIKIYAETIILYNRPLTVRFVEVFKTKKKNENEKDFIKRIFAEKSFQNPRNQIKLLYDVFCSKQKYQFPIELYKYLGIRNLLMHRNGIHEDGYVYKVTKKELLLAMQVLKEHVVAVYRIMKNVELDLISKKPKKL